MVCRPRCAGGGGSGGGRGSGDSSGDGAVVGMTDRGMFVSSAPPPPPPPPQLPIHESRLLLSLLAVAAVARSVNVGAHEMG